MSRYRVWGCAMNAKTGNKQAATAHRVERLLARLRGKQLETALRGRVEESAQYAQRAQRLQREG
jgi:hypothetical protein